MKMIQELLLQYAVLAVLWALTAIAGFFASKIKNIIERAQMDEAKRKTISACTRAVEQLYKDLDGAEKLKKAIHSASGLLQEKGIPISESEMKMLIEAEVSRL